MISSIKLGKPESQVSFDVVSLLTSIPLKTASAIVANRGDENCTLGRRRSLTVSELMEALNICLQSSFFVHNDVIQSLNRFLVVRWALLCHQKIANTVMEEIEQTALNTYLKPPSLWVRYVDDVYAIMEKTEVEPFREYLNIIFASTKFTEALEKSGQ